jgi:hypothetical protein
VVGVFHLRSLSTDELVDNRVSISKLSFVGHVGEGKRKTPIDRYSFPLQDTDLGERDPLLIPPEGEKFGTVNAIDIAARTVDIRKRRNQANVHPETVFTHSIFPSEVLAAARMRIAEDVALFQLASLIE